MVNPPLLCLRDIFRKRKNRKFGRKFSTIEKFSSSSGGKKIHRHAKRVSRSVFSNNSVDSGYSKFVYESTLEIVHVVPHAGPLLSLLRLCSILLKKFEASSPGFFLPPIGERTSRGHRRSLPCSDAACEFARGLLQDGVRSSLTVHINENEFSSAVEGLACNSTFRREPDTCNETLEGCTFFSFLSGHVLLSVCQHLLPRSITPDFENESPNPTTLVVRASLLEQSFDRSE